MVTSLLRVTGGKLNEEPYHLGTEVMTVSSRSGVVARVLGDTTNWPPEGYPGEPGEGMAILGSGSIVSQLAQEGLIDEYQVVVNPVVLGKGRTMFEGVKEKLNLKLTKSRAFGNGNVFLCYEAIG